MAQPSDALKQLAFSMAVKIDEKSDHPGKRDNKYWFDLYQECLAEITKPVKPNPISLPAAGKLLPSKGSSYP